MVPDLHCELCGLKMVCVVCCWCLQYSTVGRCHLLLFWTFVLIGADVSSRMFPQTDDVAIDVIAREFVVYLLLVFLQYVRATDDIALGVSAGKFAVPGRLLDFLAVLDRLWKYCSWHPCVYLMLFGTSRYMLVTVLTVVK